MFEFLCARVWLTMNNQNKPLQHKHLSNLNSTTNTSHTHTRIARVPLFTCSFLVFWLFSPVIFSNFYKRQTYSMRLFLVAHVLEWHKQNPCNPRIHNNDIKNKRWNNKPHNNEPNKHTLNNSKRLILCFNHYGRVSKTISMLSCRFFFFCFSWLLLLVLLFCYWRLSSGHMVCNKFPDDQQKQTWNSLSLGAYESHIEQLTYVYGILKMYGTLQPTNARTSTESFSIVMQISRHTKKCWRHMPRWWCWNAEEMLKYLPQPTWKNVLCRTHMKNISCLS